MNGTHISFHMWNRLIVVKEQSQYLSRYLKMFALYILFAQIWCYSSTYTKLMLCNFGGKYAVTAYDVHKPNILFPKKT